MKKLLIKIIKIYQNTPLSSHNLCKYQPTCSNYAILAIERYGSIKGTYLSIKRILKCAPWGRGGYDPVPPKKKD